MSEEKTAAERYRELIAKQGPEGIETLDVTAPSGFVFKFRKPSKYALLFSANKLPAFASAAAAATGGNGLPAYKDLSKEQQDELARTAFTVRDRVCELSVDPKIVIGPARPGTNELSAEDIADKDLTYLFEWTAAGGDAGLMLAQFRARSGSTPLASASRKKQRGQAVKDVVD